MRMRESGQLDCNQGTGDCQDSGRSYKIKRDKSKDVQGLHVGRSDDVASSMHYGVWRRVRRMLICGVLCNTASVCL